MDVYIYQADLYCEDCGQKICKALKRAGKAPKDPSDEYSYDSDDYPKGPTDEGEADSPNHCANGEKCVNAQTLKWKGKKVGKVGMFLETSLTSDGVDYLCEMVGHRGANDYQKALHKFWLDHYNGAGYKDQIVKCLRGMKR
jgi:hypothetical protein